MNEFTKAISALTSKRKKTDEDQNDFPLFLACYWNNKGYFLPANMIAKSFEAGAKENKLGASFKRVFVFNDGILNLTITVAHLKSSNHSEPRGHPACGMKAKVVTPDDHPNGLN